MLLKYFTWISTKIFQFVCSYEMFVIVEIWQLEICKSFAATFWSKRPARPLKHKARAAINFNSAREFPTEKVKQNLNWEIPKRILQSHCSKCQLQILTKAVEQMYFLFHQISVRGSENFYMYLEMFHPCIDYMFWVQRIQTEPLVYQ